MTDAQYIERRQIIDEGIQFGLTYSDIGRNLGLTKERIRQIVAQEMIPAAQSSWGKARERAAVIEAEIKADRELRLANMDRKYRPIIEDVEAGMSITSSAKSHGIHPQRAWIYLARRGVKSRHQSLNPNFRRPRE